MQLRYWLSLALGVTGVFTLSAGCTHDFDQFLSGGGGPGCEAGEKLCNGACVSATNPAYGCGQGCDPCDLDHAVAVCSAGACAVDECTGGFTDCDSNAANGCEADTTTDTLHCGGCNTSCVAANATTECIGGECILGPCSPGYEDCDGSPANGCEVAPATDPAHCGGCGVACTPFQSCQAGQCVLMCPAGEADCNADPADGCETALGTGTNCASCGDACSFAQATASCVQGACAIQACNAGFDDCDSVAANGCEANLTSSVATCGACNIACPSAPNATAVCAGGMCGISCIGAFRDCDGDMTNGCEVNTATSTAHCGTCNRGCSNVNVAAATCVAGLCNAVCEPGFGDCTRPAAPAPDNGCETAIDTNADHCGACGRACSGTNVASKSCSAGLCDSTCNLGSANCSMPAVGTDDGCEISSLANNSHCGGCGNSCLMQGGTFDCDRPGGGASGQKYCGCSNNGECDGDGGGAGAGSCSGTSGVCTCSGTQCAFGEDCRSIAGVNQCTCNGGVACTSGQTCCVSPVGCHDLQTSPESCGACGHACPAGFACTAGTCRCDEASDCNAGTGGAFSCSGSGLCVCNGVTCTVGKRCQPNGQCG